MDAVARDVLGRRLRWIWGSKLRCVECKMCPRKGHGEQEVMCLCIGHAECRGLALPGPRALAAGSGEAAPAVGVRTHS